MAKNQIELRKEIYVEAVEYYKTHPDEFCEDVLGIRLNFYQIIMMRAAFKAKFSIFVMSRGLGKSWLSMLIVVIYCLLYPNALAGIIAPSFRQAKKVIEEKYKDSICSLSPFVEQEESRYSCNLQQAEVEFFNGSKINAFPLGSDGGKIRGARLHIVLVDEAFKVPRIIYDQVIKPMLAVKMDYQVDDKENTESNNKIILASTAGYRANWLYEVYVDWTKRLLNGDDKYFTMSLPYTVGLRVGLYDKDIIEDAKNTMLDAEFEQEYLGLFSRLVDGSWVNYDALEKCCDMLIIETCADKISEYVISIDVARISGEDNTVINVFKLQWKKGHVEASLVYIRALNGCPFQEQAENVREILRRFPNTIRIFMDTVTIGQGLSDELAKPFYCNEEETWYPPLIDRNDSEAMKNIDITKGLPLIQGIKATPEINHRCGYAIKNYVEKGWLHLYATNAGEEQEMKRGSELTLEENLLIKQTQELKAEVLNMETKGMIGNFVKFFTRYKRKDRWSALGYGLFGILQIQKEREDDDDNAEALCIVSRI